MDRQNGASIKRRLRLKALGNSGCDITYRLFISKTERKHQAHFAILTRNYVKIGHRPIWTSLGEGAEAVEQFPAAPMSNTFLNFAWLPGRVVQFCRLIEGSPFQYPCDSSNRFSPCLCIDSRPKSNGRYSLYKII